MSNSLKPKIRFKGFTDDWEQRKLVSMAKTVGTGKSKYCISQYNKYPILGSRNIIGYDNDYDYLGDFILTARVGEYAGELYRYNGMVKITDNTVYIQGNNLDYLFYLLKRFDLKKLSFGSGQPLVKASELSNLELYVSLNSAEKDKISSLFNNIDNLITLHQRKCEKLIEIKKSLLEKMFPKNNSKIPEIRFKGFTDDWEQRKFERVFDYERPDKYIVKSNKYLERSDTPVLTANKAFVLGYTLEKNTYQKEKESIIFDDFTLDSKFVDFPYMVKSSAIKILTLKSKLTDNLRFNYELLNNTKFSVLGHARHYISVVQHEEILTTKKEEQDKIAVMFASIDNLITLHQRKCEKLIKIKQSLLKDMFV